MNLEAYNVLIKRVKPKSNVLMHVLNAFLFGGIIALIGQVFFDVYTYFFTSLDSSEISALMIITIIFLASLLTGIGVFDKMASTAGAGSFIPITGFSNALTSCALEGRSEGPIFGIGSNMFKLAGSVLVYGVCSAFFINLIRFVIGLF